jgi:Rieske Fe-S protein
MSIPYNLLNVNKYHIETFSNNNNVEVNENTFIAKGRTLTRKCPHQGCTLNYNSNRKEFVCPCHHSRFNLDGNCISGPACPNNIRV